MELAIKYLEHLAAESDWQMRPKSTLKSQIIRRQMKSTYNEHRLAELAGKALTQNVFVWLLQQKGAVEHQYQILENATMLSE